MIGTNMLHSRNICKASMSPLGLTGQEKLLDSQQKVTLNLMKNKLKVLKFVYNLKKKKISGPLVSKELEDVKIKVVKWVQFNSFREEISALQKATNRTRAHRSHFFVVKRTLLNKFTPIRGKCLKKLHKQIKLAFEE